ncbi:MAG: BadF/BadG/BcrA/BcrD ATPase family protein [Bacteroidota bacterium]
MKYYIGIDGGGTKTRCILTDENLNILKSADGFGSNPLYAGYDAAALRIISLIKKVSGSKKISLCVIGAAGVGRKANSDLLLKTIKFHAKKRSLRLPQIKLLTDIEITFEGTFSGAPGAVLIAGTGSILYARDTNNKFFRVGGFGRIIGDEGSGYSIGRKALSSISKSMDGRKRPSALLKVFRSKYKLTEANHLISLIHSTKFNIAGVAELVITLAEKGDRECIGFINEEAEELMLHINAITRIMKSRKIFLSLQGSLLTKPNYFSNKLKARIIKQFPGINLVKAKYPPEIGAVLIAKKLSS